MYKRGTDPSAAPRKKKKKPQAAPAKTEGESSNSNSKAPLRVRYLGLGGPQGSFFLCSEGGITRLETLIELEFIHSSFSTSNC